MLKPFEILKGKPKIEIILTRDSVCAGDDCDAPHEKKITIPSFTSSEALAKEASKGYLPSVAGVGHSWVCRLNEIKIAEIKVTGVTVLVKDATFAATNRMHFTYISSRS